MKALIVKLVTVIILTSSIVLNAFAGTPHTRDDGVTVINLDEFNGYFQAQETVAGLKAGKYEFVVTNKANKLVGFQIQSIRNHRTLEMFPLEPGETKIAKVTIAEDGVRFRCPINPTPWYDLDVIKE